MGLRSITVDGDVAYIQLTQGKIATIDSVDLFLVDGYNWYFNKGYARTNISDGAGGQKSIKLHRLIMSAPDGMQVDHINLDKLDNRRGNLRLATASQNQRNRGAYATNTSGYKGVVWHKGANKWRARIVCSGKKHSLGLYESKELAYAAYCDAARELHGEFARAS
jgi:hypothetical protein